VEVSIYSILMSIMWFSVFVTIFSILRRQNRFITTFSVWPLLLLFLVCIIRAFGVFEFPNTPVLQSFTVFPVIRDFLIYPLFAISGFEVSVGIALLAIWGIGSVLLLLRLIIRYAKFSKAFSRIPSTDDERLIREANELFHPKYKVKILKLDHVKVPMITGFFRPVIFFPATETLNDFISESLHHEWSHFVHKDLWIKLVVNVMCCLVWWNPLVYLLKKDLDHSLEVKCDMDVISQMTASERIKYFATILHVYTEATNKQPNEPVENSPVFAAGLVSAKSDKLIKQRFKIGLNSSNKKTGHLTNILICVLLVAVIAASYAFIIQPAEFPDEETEGAPISVISPENAYLVDNGDGTYTLYIDGNYGGDVTSIEDEPLSQLPIKTGG